MVDLIHFLPRSVQKHGQWSQHWVKQHKATVANPTNPHAQAYLAMVYGWLAYADAHNDRFESSLGEDYFLGPLWMDIGKSLNRMLNGETGGLDSGIMNGILIRAVQMQGLDPVDLG